MIKRCSFILMLISMVFSFELPWDKISIGTQSRSFINISDLSANAVSFQYKKFKYGIDAISLYGKVDAGTEVPDLSARLIVFMPRFGYSFSLRSNDKLSTSYSLESLFVIPYIDIDTGDEDTNDDMDDGLDSVKDFLDMFGIKLSYCVEYKFNRQLGISTEFGFNWLLNSIELPQEDGNIDISGRLGNTSSQISLSYYW